VRFAPVCEPTLLFEGRECGAVDIKDLHRITRFLEDDAELARVKLAKVAERADHQPYKKSFF
jgi:hypothetical protein